MDAAIALAPGAEDNALAAWARDVIARTLAERPERRRDFDALRAAVSVVATDRRLAVTLRFDHGRLTVHDGMVGVPDLTLCGEEGALHALEELPVSRTLRLPLPPLFTRGEAAERARRACAKAAGELFDGRLEIYGALSHPRALVRVLRLISSH